MPIPITEIITLSTNFLIILFITYYFLKLRAKEKQLEQKENKTDAQYHEVVNDALTKERKILDDAAHAADQIMTGAHYVNKATKEEVYNALQKMGINIQEEAERVAHDFLNTFQHSLNKLTTQSLTGLQSAAQNFNTDIEKQLTDFKETSQAVQIDLQKRIRQFHEDRLAALEKELEVYKQTRLKQSEGIITTIIREASREILNKSISIEDHQKLVLDSFESAKKKGVFD
jgi:hypothetical protein